MKYRALPTNSKLVRSLIPAKEGIVIEQVEQSGHTIHITLRAVAPAARCPDCSLPSTRVHSRYTRTLSDLPWGSYVIRLYLHTRKFFCRVSTCQRRIFTERLPEVVAPYARRSTRLGVILRLIGFALGGEAGSRLVERLQMKVSPSTLLRLVRNTPDPSPTRNTPRVLGVDDFAIRRGKTYGTILVDLEQHQPIELLPDRSAQTLENWLKEHPGVEVISRDRSTEYTKGATAGAPDAIQVADRFHILLNLRQAVERLLDRNRAQFRGIVLPLPALAGSALPQGPGTPDIFTLPLSAFRDPRPRSPAEAAAQKARHRQRRARYKQVLSLHKQGLSQREIATYLKISRTTVARYLHLDSNPTEGQRWYSPSMLDPYLPYLHERWTGGCRNGMKLWRELRAQGYPGSHSMVTRWACQQRRRQGKPMKPRKAASSFSSSPLPSVAAPTVAKVSMRPVRTAPAARQLVWFLLRDPQTMTQAEQEVLPKLKAACSELALAYELVQDFIKMVKNRTPQALDPWLVAVASSKLRDLENFATGVERDKAAVLAALSMEWSNGQVEGQVNRLKMLKRQMYGRAKFDLLRKRALNRTELEPVHQK